MTAAEIASLIGEASILALVVLYPVAIVIVTAIEAWRGGPRP